MEWSLEDSMGKCFSTFLNWAEKVTVLGERQRAKLESIGVPPFKIQILKNCSEFPPLWETQLEEKVDKMGRGEIRMLFLSNLIDTKGFVLYLEALATISRYSEKRIEAVLCGRITGSQFADRLCDPDETRNWITEKLSEINSSKTVKIRWIQGAWGEDKKALFQAADIFVFPTVYKVEAQPIVLLEAMAHGCAVITSRVGEICSSLDPDEAILLKQVNLETTLDAMLGLVENADRMRHLGKRCWDRYKREFTPVKYMENWNHLLDIVRAGTGSSD